MARKRSKKRNIFLDITDSITDLGLKLGAVTFALVLGYLLYGFVIKNGILKVGDLPVADRERVISNVAMACKILGVSGAIAVLCLAIRYYVEETLGYIMSFLGVLLYFGTPWMFSIWFPHSDIHANRVLGMVVAECRLLGVVFFAPGLILIIRDVVLRVRVAVAKPQKVDSSFFVGEQAEYVPEPYRPRLYAKCWQTPYCRAFVRGACPAYEARKSCWRKKSGCMCDPGIIERALTSQSSEGRMFMKELRYRQGDVPGKKAKLTGAQKRARCRSCVIYEFHQKQKYKLISPLVFPFVVGLVWFLYPGMKAMFREVVALTDKFVHTVTFMPQAQDKTPVGTAVPDIVLIFFVVWLAIVGISYALRFVEFCIFKIQI